ncbi:hypothetical protein G9A89_002802 [Geosiphon pyriformis]|nr:hypothetical protein G9A89_002802 [Geosiphon pyriformis]
MDKLENCYFDDKGHCYQYGKNVNQNMDQAVKLYQKASDVRNSEAMTQLGHCYFNDKCIDQDTDQAIKLYRKAADMRNSGTMN